MPLVIAHRGASAHAPENTKAALLNALAMQVDMIEVDVQLTRDQRLVLFHDARLERTTNGRGVLSRYRYHDLARLDCGSWFSPRFAGERILLVSQALRLVPPPARLNLELKRTARAAALVERLIRCLRGSRRVRHVLVSSFDAHLLRRLKAQAPQTAVALLCHRDPMRAIKRAKRLGCVALHPHKSLVSPALLHRAHTAGLRVHGWTVDRTEEARRLVRLGVDGIFTNVPDRMRQVVG